MSDNLNVKVLMLKGEKGEKGEKGDTLSNCDKLLDKKTSTSGVIYFTKEQKYRFYTIIIRGDESNGISLTIPKCVMDNDYLPFAVDVTDSINGGYSIKSHGAIHDDHVSVRGLSLTGWKQATIIVYGIY